MGNSYGFIEIQGVTAAMDALDIMCKTADVTLATWERKLGGRLVTLVVQGDVSAVTQAVEAAKQHAIKPPVNTGVLANPHAEIVRLVRLSASRFMQGKAGTENGTEKAGTTAGARPTSEDENDASGGGPIFR